MIVILKTKNHSMQKCWSRRCACRYWFFRFAFRRFQQFKKKLQDLNIPYDRFQLASCSPSAGRFFAPWAAS
jgi:hypothetical protein